jgi:hypothetical protein
MTAFARTPVGQAVTLWLTLIVKNGAPAGTTQGRFDLLLQPQGAFPLSPTYNTTFWVATYPVKVQIDSTSHVLEASAFRSSSVGDGGPFWINLNGYLEDL